MKLSIGYITARAEPELAAFLDGLLHQAQAGDEFDVIVIDALGRPAHGEGTNGAGAAAIALRRLCPKPNAWQGAFRVTDRDWWAKATALNTAIVLAQHDYFAAVDDRCTLSPEWLAVVREGERARASVLCGSYDRIEDGRRVEDGRRTLAPQGRVNCGGQWLYGCTWAAPLDWILGVNGFEEGTDGLGGEDYIFGLMLHNAGYRLDFAPRMHVTLERSAHASAGENGHAISPYRTDKGRSPKDKSHAALERFGKRSRTEFTPDLREIRARVAHGDGFELPDRDLRDWYDGQLVREMKQ